MNKTKLTCATIALIASSVASAQVYELAYTDTKYAHRVTPASNKYINPTGIVTARTVAGLDRKIRLQVKNKATNAVVFDQTSTIITVSDRITSESDSSSFYGKTFSVPTLAEGSYLFTSIVMDTANNVVSTNTYDFMVDKTKPSASSFGWKAWAHTSSDIADNTIIAPYEAYNFWVVVSPDASGIESATFEARDPSTGEALTHVGATVDTESSQVYIGNGSLNSVSNGDQFPKINGLVNATFIVKDKAGNEAALSKPIKWAGGDHPDPLYEVVGVKRNNTSTTNFLTGSPFTGYEAYYSGITTDLNPIPVVVRVKKSNWWKYNEFGYSIGNGSSADTGDSADYEDSNYVYKKLTGLSDNGGKCYEYALTYYRYRRLPYFSEGLPCHNVELSSIAPKVPKATSYAVKWSHTDWLTSLGGIYNKPWILTGLKVTTEARNYKQIASFRGASCSIPAGGTSCEVATSITVASGGTAMGSDAWLVIASEDGVLKQSVSTGRMFYDPIAPTLSSFVFDGGKTLTLKGNKSDYGALWGTMIINQSGVTVSAYNSIDNSTRTINAQSFTVDSEGSFTATFSVDGLPDGQYQFTASVTDTAKNNVTKLMAETVIIDSSAPTISFSGVSSNSIKKIEDLLVKVTDGADLSPVVTAANLKGGPIDDNLSLGFSKQSDGYYHLESPRMFPSLDDTQKYTISVSARDAQGNTASANTTFLLTPENLVALGTIKGLAVNKNLLDSSNTPLTYAKITTVKTSAGATATGAQQAYFTLRRDAAFAVVVNGMTVQPGETKAFTLTLDNTGGAVVPIYPAASGVIGTGAFMIDIPQLVTN